MTDRQALAETSLMTAGEVAHELHVSTRTVARWAKAGDLQTVILPSGRRRYRRSDVDAVLATGASAVAS